MITKTAAAWDLIRAADPMNSINISGASNEPDAQDLVRRITTGQLTVSRDPNEQQDVVTALGRQPERTFGPPRVRLAAGLAGAVVAVFAVAAIATVWQQHQTSSTLTPDRQTTAAGYSTALLAELPLPTGARRVAAPPIPELQHSAYTGNGTVNAQVAWWTVPGSFRAAVAEFGRAGALPAHWKITESSTGGTGPRSNGWFIEVRDARARFVASVTVAIATHGSRVGLLALVDTYAIPHRTPGQVISPSTDSATFTFTGGGGRGSSARLTLAFSGPRITTLARQINATATFLPLTVASCPPSSGSVTVTFRSGSRRWSLNINNGSFLCNTPSLTGTAGTSINLAPSTSLLTDVLAAAGLPSNYLDH
jgi:hypothetical protein